MNGARSVSTDWPRSFPCLYLFRYAKHLGGQMVSAPGFRSQGPGFEFGLGQNSADDCMAFHCTEPFIVTLPSSQNDLNNVERG